MKSLFILLFLCTFATIFAHHECKHDKLESAPLRTFDFPEGRNANDGRVLADTYESIRIHADFNSITDFL